MTGKKQVTIGVVGPKTGKNANHGNGIFDSIRHYLDQNPYLNSSSPFDVRLWEEDDRGDASLTIDCVRRCVQNNAALIIGPADSNCASQVVKSTEFATTPFLLSFATKSGLLPGSARNVFRTTTPDLKRVNLLLRFIRHVTKQSRIEVYVYDDHPDSYSSGLAEDVVQKASELGFEWTLTKFQNAGTFDFSKVGRSPVVLCAPAFAALAFCEVLREKRKVNPVFGFGSSNRFLQSGSEGITVVCDIDYQKNDPVVQHYLLEIIGNLESTREMSFSSILAIKIALQAIANSRPEKDLPVDQLRDKILDSLHLDTFDGLFGDVAFSGRGELVGHEQISVLTVKKRLRKYTYDEPALSARWGIRTKIAWRARAAETIALGSGILGIAGAAYALFSGEWLN